MISKPKVFVSSTIYDFHDLRSALRHFLEDKGCDVLFSEYNDFPREIDNNSYDACIEAIDTCDYFILFIGSRVGGWYKQDERISITQAEYRHAYERLHKKEIKILVFVRQSIWTIREDRKALTQFLEESFCKDRELSATDISKISGHGSRFVNDAEFVFDFINEVTRNAEMKKAVSGQSTLPEGNWIHQFSTFHDITQALRIALRTTDNQEVAALKGNLMGELVSNLQQLLHKHKSSICDVQQFYEAFVNNNEFSAEELEIQVSRHHMDCLGIAVVYTHIDSSRVRTQFITASIESGAFLHYDISTGKYSPSLFLTRLQELHVNFDKFILSNKKSDMPKFLMKYNKKNSPGDPLTVATGDIGIMCHQIDRYLDVCRLSKALIRALEGDTAALKTVVLRPISPFKDQDADLKGGIPTVEEVMNWVNS